ncbi:MAG: diguanylate cyclase [Acetatifactor sp.]|nr:diguanylate cyclase [Acetatifactor sp.]
MIESTAQALKHTNRKPQSGIRIRTLNYVMICVSVLLYLLLICITFQASRQYDTMLSATDAYIDCQKYVSLAEQSFDYLTSQARLYTTTLDSRHISDYFARVAEGRHRVSALERLREYPVGDSTSALLQAAMDQAVELTAWEAYAMRLAADSQGCDISSFPELSGLELLPEDQGADSARLLERAREMVFGAEYQNVKNQAEKNITAFLDNVMEQIRQKQQDSISALKSALVRQQVLIGILFVGTILLFVAILRLVVLPMQVCIRNISDGKQLEVSGAYEFRYMALTYNQIYEATAANILMLRNRAEHDPLTGLANRGSFDQCRQLLNGKGAPLALMIIDVNQFKKINDQYGHETGDQVLKKVASLLEYSFRDSDLPARIGGDEFAVVVMDITAEMKFVIEEKVNSINHALQHPADGLPKVSLSVGIAFSENGFPEDLYRNADKALYQIKGDEDRSYCFYEGDRL